MEDNKKTAAGVLDVGRQALTGLVRQSDLLAPTALGAATGGVVGAVRAPEGEGFSGAARGALAGGVMGLGGAYGARALGRYGAGAAEPQLKVAPAARDPRVAKIVEQAGGSPTAARGLMQGATEGLGYAGGAVGGTLGGSLVPMPSREKQADVPPPPEMAGPPPEMAGPPPELQAPPEPEAPPPEAMPGVAALEPGADEGSVVIPLQLTEEQLQKLLMGSLEGGANEPPKEAPKEEVKEETKEAPEHEAKESPAEEKKEHDGPPPEFGGPPKVASLHPALLDVMQRVRETGLHKVACGVLGLAETDIVNAARYLGTKLAYAHLRNEKIAAGLAAFDKVAGPWAPGMMIPSARTMPLGVGMSNAGHQAIEAAAKAAGPLKSGPTMVERVAARVPVTQPMSAEGVASQLFKGK